MITQEFIKKLEAQIAETGEAAERALAQMNKQITDLTKKRENFVQQTNAELYQLRGRLALAKEIYDAEAEKEVA